MNTFDQKNLEKLAKQASAGSKSTIDIFLKMLKLASKEKPIFSENISYKNLFAQTLENDTEEIDDKNTEQEADFLDTSEIEDKMLKAQIDKINNEFLAEKDNFRNNIGVLLKARYDALRQLYQIAELQRKELFERLENLEIAEGGRNKENPEQAKLREEIALVRERRDILRAHAQDAFQRTKYQATKKPEEIFSTPEEKRVYTEKEKQEISQKISRISDGINKILTKEFADKDDKKNALAEYISENLNTMLVFLSLYAKNTKLQHLKNIYEEASQKMYEPGYPKKFAKALLDKQEDNKSYSLDLKIYLFGQLKIARDQIVYDQIRHQQRFTSIDDPEAGIADKLKTSDDEIEIEENAKNVDFIEMWKQSPQNPGNMMINYYMKEIVMPELDAIDKKIDDLEASDLGLEEKRELRMQYIIERRRAEDDLNEAFAKTFFPAYDVKKGGYLRKDTRGDKGQMTQFTMYDLQRQVNKMISELELDDLVDLILESKENFELLPKPLRKEMEKQQPNIFLVQNILDGLIKSELIVYAKDALEVAIPSSMGAKSALSQRKLIWHIVEDNIKKATEYIEKDDETKKDLLEKAMDLLLFEKPKEGETFRELPIMRNFSNTFLYSVTPIVLNSMLLQARRDYPNFAELTLQDQNEILENIHNKMFGTKVVNPKNKEDVRSLGFGFPDPTSKDKYHPTMQPVSAENEELIKEDLRQKVQRFIDVERNPALRLEKLRDEGVRVFTAGNKYSTLELMIRKYAFKR